MRHAQRRVAQWFAKAGIVRKTRTRVGTTSRLAASADRPPAPALHQGSIVSTTIYTSVDPGEAEGGGRKLRQGSTKRTMVS